MSTRGRLATTPIEAAVVATGIVLTLGTIALAVVPALGWSAVVATPVLAAISALTAALACRPHLGSPARWMAHGGGASAVVASALETAFDSAIAQDSLGRHSAMPSNSGTRRLSHDSIERTTRMVAENML